MIRVEVCRASLSERAYHSANGKSRIIGNVAHLSISREANIDLFVISLPSQLDIRFKHFMNLFVSRNAVGFAFRIHHKATDDLRENVSLFHINGAMCRLSSC